MARSVWRPHRWFALIHGSSMPPCRTFESMASPVSWPDYDAVLFDLDGVLTPTADVHQRAWTTMFDEFLATAARPVRRSPTPTTSPTSTGDPASTACARSSRSRGITLPEGDPTTRPATARSCALGNRKNDVVPAARCATEGIAPYPGSVRLLDALGDEATSAVVSSSRNAREVLEASGLAPRFDGRRRRRDARRRAPAGQAGTRPVPRRGAPPRRRAGDSAVVVEDAVSGVAAGRAGDFGLVHRRRPRGRPRRPARRTAPTSSSTTSGSSCP